MVLVFWMICRGLIATYLCCSVQDPPPNAHAWSDKVIHVNDETNLWRKIEAFRAIKAVISEVDFKQTGYI